MLFIAGIYPVTRVRGQDRWAPAPFSCRGHTSAWPVIWLSIGGPARLPDPGVRTFSRRLRSVVQVTPAPGR